MNEENNITNCPKCSSNNITLDISIGKLKCNYCGHIIENEEFKEDVTNISELENKVVSEGASELNTKEVSIVNLKCPNCGIEYIAGESSTYPKCSWCNKDLILDPNPVENPSIPIAILPFKVTKEEAINSLQQAMEKKKKYTTKAFNDSFNPQNIIGVYIPYMLINVAYKCDFEGVGGHLINKHYDSENHNVTYDYDTYNVVRVFDITANHITLENKDNNIVDRETANKNIISAANPFDTSEIVQLEGKYLEGFIAEKFKPQELQPNEELYNKLINVAKYGILNDISFYDCGVRWEKNEISVDKAEYMYAYLPVWIYTYKEVNKNGEEEIYYVGTNGRTNEAINHIPLNYTKALLGAMKTATVISIIVAVILGLIYLLFMSNFFRTNTILVFIINFFTFGVPLFMFIASTIIEYKNRKKRYLGKNVKDENDGCVDTNIYKIDYSDIKRGTEKNKNRDIIKGVNDNGDEIRRKKLYEKLNIKSKEISIAGSDE